MHKLKRSILLGIILLRLSLAEVSAQHTRRHIIEVSLRLVGHLDRTYTTTYFQGVIPVVGYHYQRTKDQSARLFSVEVGQGSLSLKKYKGVEAIPITYLSLLKQYQHRWVHEKYEWQFGGYANLLGDYRATGGAALSVSLLIGPSGSFIKSLGKRSRAGIQAQAGLAGWALRNNPNGYDEGYTDEVFRDDLRVNLRASKRGLVWARQMVDINTRLYYNYQLTRRNHLCLSYMWKAQRSTFAQPLYFYYQALGVSLSF